MNKYCKYIALMLFVLSSFFLFKTCEKVNESKKLVEKIEYIDSLNQYNKVYYDKSFSELKKENKMLYDSLKKYKNQIGFLVQFKHEKEYNTGIVKTKPKVKDSIVHSTTPVSYPNIARTYEYVSEPNDTFQYKLDINSFTEPNWYSIRAKVNNKFTIVNKEEGETNHLTIKPDNGGVISDVTVFDKKENRSVWKRIAVGPSITAGYDPFNKSYGVMVGLSATFDITK